MPKISWENYEAKKVFELLRVQKMQLVKEELLLEFIQMIK